MTGDIRPLRADLNELKIEREPEQFGPRRKWPFWVTFIVLFAIVVALGQQYWKSNVSIPKVKVTRAVRVTSDQANAILTSSGYVQPRRKATIGAQVSGRITALMIDEGSKVKQGEVIAEIDSKDYAARFNEAKANLADAQRELDRQKNLLASKVGTQQAVDAQQTRFEVYQAQLELAEFNLTNTKVRAPFDGTILQKMTEVGETLSSAAVVVSGSTSSGAICVLASEELEFEADVNESNFSRIAEGQEAEIILDAFPDRRYPGKLRLVEPRADRQKAIVQAKISFLSPTHDLRPEMGGKVNFLRSIDRSRGSNESFVQVPSSAIVQSSGKSAVYLLDGDRLELRHVQIKKTEGGLTQIQSGLDGGEKLVAAPGPELSDGIRVKPQE